MKCEFCGMESRSLSAHRKRCTHNPEVWRRTQAALDDGTGTIRPAHRYKGMANIPVSDTTLRKIYGTWSKVADAFGLRWHGLRNRPDQVDEPLTRKEKEWAIDNQEPVDVICLHGYSVRKGHINDIIVHEYIALR